MFMTERRALIYTTPPPAFKSDDVWSTIGQKRLEHNIIASLVKTQDILSRRNSFNSTSRVSQATCFNIHITYPYNTQWEIFCREFPQSRCTELQLKLRLAGLHLQLKRVAHEQNTKLATRVPSEGV